MTSQSLLAAIDANRDRPCSTPRCVRLRYRLEATCQTCSRRYRAYGSGVGRAIPAAAWKPYRSEVQRLLSVGTNAQHPAFLEAVQIVENWMQRALQADEPNERDIVVRFPGYKEAQRLVRSGVTARLIVETLAALSMYLAKAKLLTVLEERHAYARAVFGLAHRNAKVTWASGQKKVYRDRATRASLVTAGGFFMAELGLFMSLAQHGVEDMVEGASKRAAAREAARRAPFAMPA